MKFDDASIDAALRAAISKEAGWENGDSLVSDSAMYAPPPRTPGSDVSATDIPNLGFDRDNSPIAEVITIVGIEATSKKLYSHFQAFCQFTDPAEFVAIDTFGILTTEVSVWISQLVNCAVFDTVAEEVSVYTDLRKSQIVPSTTMPEFTGGRFAEFISLLQKGIDEKLLDEATFVIRPSDGNSINAAGTVGEVVELVKGLLWITGVFDYCRHI